MKHKLCVGLWSILFAACLSSFALVAAQTQNPVPASATAKRGETGYQVQLQMLVGSNIVTAKTDYPGSLEAVVRQLKSSLSFKHHRLAATYLYSVADSSNVEVSDVTYTALETGGALLPTFLNIGIGGIKVNASDDSLHLSRFKFEARKRIFILNTQSEGSGGTKTVFDTVTTGINTEMNLREGVPTVVGTLTSALSDGVLVLVITVNSSGRR